MPGIKKTMEEFKKGTLHSGSKSGPVVTNRKQAIAIGMSEQRKGMANGGEVPSTLPHAHPKKKFAAGGTVEVPATTGTVRGMGAAKRGRNFKGVF